MTPTSQRTPNHYSLPSFTWILMWIKEPFSAVSLSSLLLELLPLPGHSEGIHAGWEGLPWRPGGDLGGGGFCRFGRDDLAALYTLHQFSVGFVSSKGNREKTGCQCTSKSQVHFTDYRLCPSSNKHVPHSWRWLTKPSLSVLSGQQRTSREVSALPQVSLGFIVLSSFFPPLSVNQRSSWFPLF